MAEVRAEISYLPGGRTLPEDACINTLHFAGNGNDYQGLADALLAIFDGTTSGPGNRGPFSLYTGYNITVSVYDIADDKPRPVRGHAHSPGNGQAPGTPSLLACCLSFYSARNLPRQRGRIFVGPVAFNGTINSEHIPGAITDLVIDLGAILLSGVSGWGWVAYSRTDHQSRPVTNVWVDDVWDVQHSRELGPSQRKLYP